MPEMSMKERARRVAALRFFIEELKKVQATERSELCDQMQHLGVDRSKPELDDGSSIATISVQKPEVKARVVDMDSLALHVSLTLGRPDEVITRREVRSSYLAVLLKEVATTGEVIPGVELYETQAGIRVTLDKHAGPALIEAIRSRSLDLLAPSPTQGEDPPINRDSLTGEAAADPQGKPL